MDLGCKLICGEWAPGRAIIPVPIFPNWRECTEIFSTFLFFASEEQDRARVGQHGAGGGVCRLAWPPCTSTNAVSVFSLSLSRACTPVPTRHPGWPVPRWGASRRRQAAPPVPPAARAPAHRPPASHRLLLSGPPGPQRLGQGEPRIDCAPPRSPHQKYRRRTEDSEGQRGIVTGRRSGRLTCSCTKLSPCPPPPPVSLLVFFLPPSPTSTCPGSAQVNSHPPSLPASWVTSSRHVSSSFCVCLFKLVFLPPLFFSAPPPSSAM